jgi:hypothetical protein
MRSSFELFDRYVALVQESSLPISTDRFQRLAEDADIDLYWSSSKAK